MCTSQPTESALTRETILCALARLSEKLGKQGIVGELCLFGGTVKTQYLVEGLFEEGRV